MGGVDAPIYVLTSDKYLPALRGYAYLLNRYWKPNPQVVVGGFTPPDFQLPRNFSFHSIGKYEDYPVARWSNALIRLLLEMPHDVFVLMLEDYWLTGPVDGEAVQVCADYMKQFEYVARFDLTGDRLHSGFAKDYGMAGNVPLIISDPDSPYHFSYMTALWRRQHLLKILIENETPWESELNGTPRLRLLKDYVIVLGTKTPPVKHTLALRGGDHGKLLTDELRPDDVAEMDKLGMLHYWR